MGYFYRKDKMTHTIADKQKLLNRVRRLRGQVDAIERALESEAGCTEVLRLLTAGRGAINSLMAEVVEDHIHMHMIDEGRKPSRTETEAANELIDVLRTYIK
jgi:DNA-binding FrmR family transcriptional regulator